jgi:Cu/Ag efflux pump CusA
MCGRLPPVNRPGSLKIIIPLTLALVFVMVYLNNRFMAKVTIVFLWSPPFPGTADLLLYFHCVEVGLRGEKAKNCLSQE